MTRVNFYLTEKQKLSLNLLTKETGLTMSEIFRRALDEYIEKQRDKK